ncbi:MAG: hypothetical protein Kow00104_16540 [Rhodothalassiaceae bacterium]
MHNSRLPVLILLLALLLAPLIASAQQVKSPGAVKPPEVAVDALELPNALPNFANRNEVEAWLDGVIEGRMRAERIAGVTLALVRDDETLLVKSYGLAAPGRPAHAGRDMFPLGAIADIHAAIALLQLVADGRIGSGDKVSCPNADADSAMNSDDRSGSVMNYPPLSGNARSIGSLALASQADMACARMIVARLSGMGYADHIDRHVTSPLALAAAGGGGPPVDDSPRERAHGFVYRDGTFRPMPEPPPVPDGSWASSADMALILRLLLGDRTLERAAGLAPEARKRLLQDLPALAGPPGLAMLGLSGAAPHFRAMILLIPDRGLGLFLAANSAGAEGLLQDLPQMLIARFFTPPAPLPAEHGPDAQERRAPLAAYSGLYLPRRIAGDDAGSFHRAWLRAIRIDKAGGQEGLVLTRGGRSSLYIPHGDDIFRAADGYERIVFVRDEEDRIRSLRTLPGNETMVRTAPFRAPWVLAGALMAGAVAGLAILASGLAGKRTRTAALPRNLAISLQFMRGAAAFWIATALFFTLAALRMSRSLDPAFPDSPGPFPALLEAAALPATAFTLMAVLHFLSRPGAIKGVSARRFAFGHGLALLSWIFAIMMLYHWQLIAAF